MVKTYFPNNLIEALNIRKETNAIPYAGGTDLMVKNKSWGGALPRHTKDILYIGDLEELKGINIEHDKIIIGAATKLASIVNSRLIPDYLRQPVRSIGSPAIRNLGTLGGNICNASPAGDSLPSLYALNAEMEISSAEGKRIIGISDFITGPGKTILKENEILTKVLIPIETFSFWRFQKTGSRKANAIAKLSVFVAARLENGMIEEIRVAFGALGPVVVRSQEIENRLTGSDFPTRSELLDEVLERYRNVISPISDVRSTRDYRHSTSIGILKEMLQKELIL